MKKLVIDGICVCGGCASCRRSMREAEAEMAPIKKPFKHLDLSPFAQQILDEVKNAAKVDEARSRGEVTKRAGRAKSKIKSKANEIIPVECDSCGEIRSKIKYGRGFRLAGADGKCELCVDRERFAQQLADHESGKTVLRHTQILRAKRHIARVMRDGRPFSTELEIHGRGKNYSGFGCRCAECIEVHNMSRKTSG